MDAFKIILIHQLFFQGMFLFKNIYLSKKLGIQIRGKNKEASAVTISFVLTILTALSIAYFDFSWGLLDVLYGEFNSIIGIAGVFLSTFVAGLALIDLRDSWRVGVIEEQSTELITAGIYRYSRNPFFTSYILMFISYNLFLPNTVLLLITAVSLYLLQKLVLKEEAYLLSLHGGNYEAYKKVTPRYLII